MHQNRSHHHHGTAEGSFTAKKWFGHRAGPPCAHSIGKFFLCYIVLFSSTCAPGSPGNYLKLKKSIFYILTPIITYRCRLSYDYVLYIYLRPFCFTGTFRLSSTKQCPKNTGRPGNHLSLFMLLGIFSSNYRYMYISIGPVKRCFRRRGH